jgi:hypothetical protein
MANTTSTATVASNAKIFTQFNTEDVIANQLQTITDAVWSTGTGELTTLATSSAQATGSSVSGRYYVDVYQTDTGSVNAAVQFSIAYGNYLGSGSKDFDGAQNTALTPSKAVYSQYANWLLQQGQTQFKHTGSTIMTHFIAIALQRARMKGKLDPGNWQLSLSNTNEMHMIDDSSLSTTSNTSYTLAGAYYNVVSGSLSATGTVTIYSPTTYVGLVYPDAGIIILDCAQIQAGVGGTTFNTGSDTDPNPRNHLYAYGMISASTVLGNGFQARNAQSIKSNYYFVRVKNTEYNYSNNPSFITGSVGDLKYNSFAKDPKVYVTTVGLYNPNNELMAVAKLSKPLLKDFTRELLVRVKIDF